MHIYRKRQGKLYSVKMLGDLNDTFILQQLDPRSYLRAYAQNGVRADARNLNDMSNVIISKNTYTENTFGSSLIKWGDSSAACGVTLDVVTPLSSTPNDGEIVFDVSLWSFCSPKYERSKPAEARDIEHVLNNIIKKNALLDRKQLCILTGEMVLQLRVSILFLSAGGSLNETAVLAAVSALSSTRIPTVKTGLKIGPVPILNADACVPLVLRSLPVYVSVSSFEGYLLVDPSQQERETADSLVSLAIDETGQISYLSQTCPSGEATSSPGSLRQAIELLTPVASTVRRLIM